MGKNKEYIRPFRFQVLQSFPFIAEDFDQLTDYALFCKLVEKMNEVIGNENEVIKKLNEFQEYFDNLDVQDEIDNKLDEMAEDGTLQEIIAAYLNSKAVFGFDNVESMINSTNLINGSYAKTMGYYSINDGGAATYRIRTITNDDVVNNIDILAMANDNTLIAELIQDAESVNILQLGCKGNNTFDNTERIQRGIDQYNNIYIPNGQFLITDTLVIYRYTKITGENKLDSIIIMSPAINKTIIQTYDFDNLTGNESPYWQWDERTICFFELKNFRIDGNYRDNTNQVNKTSGNGLNIYGASYIIDNLFIDNCAGVGLYQEWTNPTSAQTYYRAGNQIAKINVDINNCGEEAVINDLADSQFDRLFTGGCGIKGISNYLEDNTTCSSVVIVKGCEAAGEWHIFGNSKGYGLYISNSSRFRCNSLIIESCCGGILTDTTSASVQIGDLHLHNMIYENSNYQDNFYYIHQKNSLLFDVSNCIIREYDSSLDLSLICIEGSRMSLNNCYLSQTTDKTSPSIINDGGSRFNLQGLAINGNKFLSGNITTGSYLNFRIINYNLVVDDTFTIGQGSKCEFYGNLYENQKFSTNLINHPPTGSFVMNMHIDGNRYAYPGVGIAISPNLTAAATNRWGNIYYYLPFKLEPNEIVAYMYKDEGGDWGDVNISIVCTKNEVNSSGAPYCPIKYIHSGTTTATDYHLTIKYGF